MNKRLETAIAMARDLPEEEQEFLADIMAFHMHQSSESLLTPDQIAEVERRMADPNKEYIPYEEVFERLKRRFG